MLVNKVFSGILLTVQSLLHSCLF